MDKILMFMYNFMGYVIAESLVNYGYVIKNKSTITCVYFVHMLSLL